jgi:protein transport protein SEC24
VGVSSELLKIFKAADLDTVVNILGRQISEEISEFSAPEIRKRSIKKVVDLLATYRKKCSTAQKDGQLILPDALKLLPIYSLGLLKTPLCAPLKPGTLHFSLADTRAYFYFLFNSLPLRDQSCLLYPLFFEIHAMPNHPYFGKLEEDSPFVQFPGQIRLTRTVIEKSGIYLMDCLQRLYLWIGKEVDRDLVDKIVPPEIAALDMNTMVALPRIDTDLSDRLFNLLSSPRLQRCLSPEIYLIWQGSQLEQRLLKYMLEDGFTGASVTDAKDMNYVDYLCHLHKKIINLS